MSAGWGQVWAEGLLEQHQPSLASDQEELSGVGLTQPAGMNSLH